MPAPRTPAPSPAWRPGRFADLVVLGRVVTMDPTTPEAEAIAIADGRIAAVGTRAEVEAQRGPDTEVLELGDHVLYPGFVEPHAHLWVSAVIDHWVDCSPITRGDVASIHAALREAAAVLPADGWLMGKQYDPSLLAGEPALTRDLLDAIAPDHPALVLNASLHYVYANSRAIAAAGVDAIIVQDPAVALLARQLCSLLDSRPAVAINRIGRHIGRHHVAERTRRAVHLRLLAADAP